MNKITTELEEKLLNKRFTIHELEEELGVIPCLGGNDIDACNIADYDLMCEYMGYDVDIYCLIDRHGKFYITEIGVNEQ